MAEEHCVMPAEWAPHAACWTAFPFDETLWLDDLRAAQDEFVAFCRHVAASEPLRVLVPDIATGQRLVAAVAGSDVQAVPIPYGDIWVRDTGPLFVRQQGELVAACFAFNGWGNKYNFTGDEQLSARIAAASGCQVVRFAPILEGGSVEVDGEGTCLTSRQCLLNPNRNAHLDAAGVAAFLRHSLGVDKVLWVDEGLQNDHTDGHIDTLARFVAPGHVVVMAPSGHDDPNAAVLRRIRDALKGQTDARGRRLEVTEVPSPGRVEGADGALLPASHLNFYIGNTTVVVPTYGTPYDATAVQALAPLFPSRAVVGSRARAILTGGGAFHCMTQQQPLSV